MLILRFQDLRFVLEFNSWLIMARLIRQCGLCFIIFFLSCKGDSELPANNPEMAQQLLAQMPPDSVLRANPFSIQVAALMEQANAVELIQRLRGANLRPFTITHTNIVGKTIYRIRVGPYADKNDAQLALERLEQMGYRQAFIKLHVTELPEPEQTDTTESPAEVPKYKKITTFGDCANPQWSPTGREIAFFRSGTEGNGIYAIGSGGGAVSRLAEMESGLEITGAYAWSPNGLKIAYASRQAEEGGSNWTEYLNVVGRDGLKSRSVWERAGAAVEIINIRWAPDGSAIAMDVIRNDRSIDNLNDVIVLSLNREELPVGIARDDENIRSIGWLSNNQVLAILSKARSSANEGLYDEPSDDEPLDNDAKVVVFDIDIQQLEILFPISSARSYNKIDLLPDSQTIVLISVAGSSQFLTFVNFANGQQHTLFEGLLTDSELGDFAITRDEKVYFLLDSELWVNSLEGRQTKVSLPPGARNLTVSDSGEIICYVLDGDLCRQRIVIE